MGKFCASALLISALVAVCFFSNVYADWGVVPGIGRYYPLKIRFVSLDAKVRWDVDERLLADVTALYVFSVGESVEAWQFYGYSFDWRFPSSVKWFQPIPPNSSNLDVRISDVPMQWDRSDLNYSTYIGDFRMITWTSFLLPGNYWLRVSYTQPVLKFADNFTFLYPLGLRFYQDYYNLNYSSFFSEPPTVNVRIVVDKFITAGSEYLQTFLCSSQVKRPIPSNVMEEESSWTVNAVFNASAEDFMLTIANTTLPSIALEVIDTETKKPLEKVEGVERMAEETKSLTVNFYASVARPLQSWNESLYINSTKVVEENYFWNPPCKGWTRSFSLTYTVAGVNYLTIDLTVYVNHSSVSVHKIIVRDYSPPDKPTYTSTQVICGGVIIKGLKATDNVGVSKLIFYINGSIFEPPITIQELYSPTLTPRFDPSWVATQGIVVLNLTKYVGKAVNMTVKAVDMVGYESPETCIGLFNVPKGEWYPIQLYGGWNLISLPLIPANSSREAILSLTLKHGIAGVKATYAYFRGSWILNPSTMSDGNGYWVYVNAYDILIVQGFKLSEVWAPYPRTYTLYKGYNLLGFTSTQIRTLAEYFASIDMASYYRFIYIWDTVKQNWKLIDAKGGGVLKPGQAFWIYMYEEAVLIPPP